jgi:ketosteroid isomerase-like protein
MKILMAVIGLVLLVGCQAPPAEMTEAEIAQIEAEVLQAAEDWFDGFRQHDLDILMAGYHPTETSFAGSRAPRDYATVQESWGNQFEDVVKYDLEWTETVVKVLSHEAAMFQGYYDATGTYADGRILRWPGNVSFTVLMERTPDGWKITMGSGTNGTAQRIDQLFGIYDWVPNDAMPGGWVELRPDGSWTSTVIPPDGSDPIVEEGQSTLGGRVDGCFPLQAWSNETPDEIIPATICDGVFATDDGDLVANKRQ